MQERDVVLHGLHYSIATEGAALVEQPDAAAEEESPIARLHSKVRRPVAEQSQTRRLADDQEIL